MFIAPDMYISDKGRLIASIFSLYNVVESKGEQYNQGELLRWLGESIIYAADFLFNRSLNGSSLNLQLQDLHTATKGLSLFFKIQI